MTVSDLPLLNQVLEKLRSDVAPDMKESEFFELFTAQHILRDYRIGPEDIETGLVGGDEEKNKTGSDGGIDGFYVLVDKNPINDLDAARALKSIKHKAIVDVVIIQASLQNSFTMDAVLRLKDTSENIFDLHRTQFTEQYNEALADAIERFRATHEALLLREPTISVTFFYATRGNSETVARDIKLKADDFALTLKDRLLPTVEHSDFVFMGARELYQLFHKPPKTEFPLKCTSVMTQGKSACVALVKLRDYFQLIRNEKTKEIQAHLFESNIRDYQGSDLKINEGIQHTLSKGKDENFWWLNNGITIIVESLGGFTPDLVLHDPQIVNGLQTSQEIFNFFTTFPRALELDDRDVLVKIIASNSAELQDKVIRATNSQIAIPVEFLWATDPIHRDIATFFGKRGLYYDRRKNSWRREEIPLAKVVGITELAQAVAAIRLQEPDNARARPSRYFQDKRSYKKVFDPANPIEMYLLCARLGKRQLHF